jgi:hypothetical protein
MDIPIPAAPWAGHEDSSEIHMAHRLSSDKPSSWTYSALQGSTQSPAFLHSSVDEIGGGAGRQADDAADRDVGDVIGYRLPCTPGRRRTAPAGTCVMNSRTRKTRTARNSGQQQGICITMGGWK